MKIAVIGAGNMGSAFTKQLTRVGHQVSVASRDPAKAQSLAATYAGATAVHVSQAAASADVLVLATGFTDAADALRSLGDLQDKVVIDITNPLTADYMGLTVGHTTSAAEQLAAQFPNIKLVKGFNTLFAQVLSDGPQLGQQVAPVFLAGDNEAAKQTARALAESMGFDVIDAGGLKNARYLEPLAGLNIYLGYGAGLGTAIAPTWIRKN